MPFVAVDQHRVGEAVLADRAGDQRHLRLAVGAGVAGVGDQRGDRAVVDRQRLGGLRSGAGGRAFGLLSPPGRTFCGRHAGRLAALYPMRQQSDRSTFFRMRCDPRAYADIAIDQAPAADRAARHVRRAFRWLVAPHRACRMARRRRCPARRRQRQRRDPRAGSGALSSGTAQGRGEGVGFLLVVKIDHPESAGQQCARAR